jgi:hypothetical protein
MLMCALAGTCRHTNSERYVGIVLDGLRAAPREQSTLPPVVDG